MISMEIKGDIALQRQLNCLSHNMRKKHVRYALRKAARPIQLAAQAKAPRDTGALGKAIYLRNMHLGWTGLFLNAIVAVAVGISKSHMEKRGLYWYGHYQELGTSKLRAVKYLRNAFAAEKSRTMGRFQTALWYRIGLELRKL